jgi:CBS domain-containing protein
MLVAFAISSRGPQLAVIFVSVAPTSVVPPPLPSFHDTGVAVERVISVRPTDVLGTAMNMMMATRMHRVWIVDRKSGRPSGLLSIADVLAFLSERLHPKLAE